MHPTQQRAGNAQCLCVSAVDSTPQTSKLQVSSRHCTPAAPETTLVGVQLAAHNLHPGFLRPSSKPMPTFDRVMLRLPSCFAGRYLLMLGHAQVPLSAYFLACLPPSLAHVDRDTLQDAARLAPALSEGSLIMGIP